MNQTEIRVLIADNETVFREGLKLLIQTPLKIKIVGEACNGEILLEQAYALKPDIILTDIAMPIMDGIAASKELFKKLPDSRVIALSAHAKDEFILQMIELGAMGYLVKSAEIEEIKEAIYTVYNRKPYFCKTITARLTEIVSRNYKLPLQNNRMFSEREQQIIQLICKEFTSKEIAETLHLSKRTVEGHRTRIMSKIGAKSIAGIITYAVQRGIYKKEQ